ncbi:helix-turn-helix transcriptional regulator [Rhizobium laguerreae]|uniref:helix-turn-helix transcriptional regulator n=1 Tax=Rhizobium laguerreae TaxID=1076926 RepID=UPI001C9294C8|nr:AraC family transcriptional regulator [Rhizobium laguerreae]MBY3219094.1 helix-turn-helix transcriptional regulator [Rhizobium laguerreae]
MEPISSLSDTLMTGLARFRVNGNAGNIPHAPGLFSYCSLARERLIAVDLQKPIVGVVLSGTKEVWRGINSCVLRPGDLFVLPTHVQMDILNVPDDMVGRYQSMIMEIADAELPAIPARNQRPKPERGSFAVGLTRHIVDAVIHAASELADGPVRPILRRSRLTELLALLQDEPAAAPLFDASTTQRVRSIVGTNLSRDWKAPEVAAAIGMSESTFRRRLSVEGQSFTKILRWERMNAAHRLIGEHEQSQAAAALVGYASRAHFARHFKSQFGANPRELRRRGISTDETAAARANRPHMKGA